MITKISMENVASYKALTTLETSKPVNLVYGLNGSGKTTISKYLRNPEDEAFERCDYEHDGSSDFVFRVYNQSFIDDVFFNQDTQKGIFTLSKKNKVAEQKIAEAKRQQSVIRDAAAKITKQAEDNQQAIDRLTTETQNSCFKIKQDHTGGDRILDEADFLKGYKTKAPLLQHLLKLKKTDTHKSVDEIKKEVDLLNKASSDGVDLLPTIESSSEFNVIETNSIFQEVIVGQSNSSLSSLIDHLKSSDWFTKGLPYLTETDGKCPFCQQAINDTLQDEILSYLNEAYKTKKKTLSQLNESYQELVSTLPEWNQYAESLFFDNVETVKASYDTLIATMSENVQSTTIKCDTPSQGITLKSTEGLITTFNQLIGSANQKIKTHNQKVAQKDTAIAALKSDFWQTVRNEYDHVITNYRSELKKLETVKSQHGESLVEKHNDYKKLTKVIKEQQGQTENIDETIININGLLQDCALTGFEIVKHEDRFYRIAREGVDLQAKVFTSLSEGEKTMISFFYFLELCRGKEDPDETQEKIIVIDDPISSLSHMYIFNIAQLIKREFTDAKLIKGEGDEPNRGELKNKAKYRQCFILTHSLYFFYEMTETKHELRKVSQSLFRVSKGESGSRIQNMKYEEIQNDYQSYWSIIRDKDSPPALLANSMRNIIEYFFNFIEKKDLNNTFRQEELQNVKYQSFYRYINRESHSLGQNIFDTKEFNFEVFQDAFRLVFETTGYPDHYKKMMKS